MLYALPGQQKYPIPNAKKAMTALTFTTWHQNKKDARKVQKAVRKHYPEVWSKFQGKKLYSGKKSKGQEYSFYKFHQKGALHRNILLNTLEDKYGVSFRDYDLSPTGIKAKNSETEKILSKLFSKSPNSNQKYSAEGGSMLGKIFTKTNIAIGVVIAGLYLVLRKRKMTTLFMPVAASATTNSAEPGATLGSINTDPDPTPAAYVTPDAPSMPKPQENFPMFEFHKDFAWQMSYPVDAMSMPLSNEDTWHADIEDFPYMGEGNIQGGGGRVPYADVPVPPAANLYGCDCEYC